MASTVVVMALLTTALPLSVTPSAGPQHAAGRGPGSAYATVAAPQGPAPQGGTSRAPGTSAPPSPPTEVTTPAARMQPLNRLATDRTADRADVEQTASGHDVTSGPRQVTISGPTELTSSMPSELTSSRPAELTSSGPTELTSSGLTELTSGRPTEPTSNRPAPDKQTESKMYTALRPTSLASSVGPTGSPTSKPTSEPETRPVADEQTITTSTDGQTPQTAKDASRPTPTARLADASSASSSTPAASSTATEDSAGAGTSPPASLLEIVVEESTETGALDIDLSQPETAAPSAASTSTSTSPPSSSTASETTDAHGSEGAVGDDAVDESDKEIGGVVPPVDDIQDDIQDDIRDEAQDVRHNEVLDEDAVGGRVKHKGPWLIGSRTRTGGQDDGEASLGSSSTSSAGSPSLGLYRNYDVDSQERERELEERAREQTHPADLEDSNVHEVNHYVPEQEEDDPPQQQQQQQKRSVSRWYLLLLAGNTTTVRLRQKDFAKYLKLNLAARLSVEYNDLRVNRVEFKPLLMVNVTIFSRPKDNEEAPLHMLADTNATLLELSGEEYHVVRFITIPSEHQEALASGGFQADSYTGANTLPPRHVDMGVAVYFAIAAALVSILLAVFLVGLCRYLRSMAAEVSWPWRRYKPIVFPRWSLPLQHRLCADHIAHCAPLRRHGLADTPPCQQAVWTTAEGVGDVPVQKILAPEPRRLVFAAEPCAATTGPPLPPILCGDAAPSTADTLLQAQPAPSTAPGTTGPGATPVHGTRPNSKLSLFGEQQVVVSPARSALAPGDRPQGRNRLQPQGRHPLDVRIGSRRGPTILGLDNPNYMLQ